MTSDQTAVGDRLLGSLRAEGGKVAVRMEDRYPTGVADLWSAITDPRRLARWIARVDGDLRAGGQFRASFVSGCDGPGRRTVDIALKTRERQLVQADDGHAERRRRLSRACPDRPNRTVAADVGGAGARPAHRSPPCRTRRPHPPTGH